MVEESSFYPDVLLAYTIGVTHYSKATEMIVDPGDLTKKIEIPRFETLAGIDQDLKDMKLAFDTFGFETTNIENPTYSSMEMAMNDIHNEILRYLDEKKTVLVAVYFSGYGFMDADGSSLIVLDEDGKKGDHGKYRNYIYPLEYKLRRITEENAFIIPFFDCCRLDLPEKDKYEADEQVMGDYEDFVKDSSEVKKFLPIYFSDAGQGVKADAHAAKTVQ